MTTDQARRLAELWGIASVCSASSHYLFSSALQRVALPSEAAEAAIQRAQIEIWLLQNEWPGDHAFEKIRGRLVALHGAVFDRRKG